MSSACARGDTTARHTPLELATACMRNVVDDSTSLSSLERRTKEACVQAHQSSHVTAQPTSSYKLERWGTLDTPHGQQQNQTSAQVRAAMLTFMTLDASDKQILRSGILNEV